MNRGIFQIWKSKYMNNKQINKFTIIRFMEVGRYEIHPDLTLNNYFFENLKIIEI